MINIFPSSDQVLRIFSSLLFSIASFIISLRYPVRFSLIISLIPKDENNLMALSNWRALTLLNVDNKILARAIAKRIESKLPKLVYSDQTGFVKG